MTIRIYSSSLIFVLVTTLLVAEPAYAHGFGERYDLPVPLVLYLGGAVSAVVYSFVVIGLFLKTNINLNRYPTFNILKIPLLSTPVDEPSFKTIFFEFSISIFN